VVPLHLVVSPQGDPFCHTFTVVLQLLTERLPVTEGGPGVSQLNLCLRVAPLQSIVLFLRLR